MKTKTPISKRIFDTSIRPQDDFYRFVNGGWLNKTTIPDTQATWGAFHILRDINLKRMHAILKELGKKEQLSTEEKKLRDLFQTSIDMRKRDKQSLAYLEKELSCINDFNAKSHFHTIFARLHKYGVDAPWDLYVDQDDKNSDRMVLRICQGGIGVPDRNYLVKKDKESKRILAAYKAYMHKALRLTGYYDPVAVSDMVNSIIRIETKLARVSMTPEERRDAQKVYNKYTQSQLKKLIPEFDWKRYFDLLGIPNKARSHIIVNQPDFLKEVRECIVKLTPEEWVVYLSWHFLDSYTGSTSQDFVDAKFEYTGRSLQGLTKQPELWKRSVRVVDGLLPDALGKLYVKKHFPPEAKKEVTQLVHNLKKAYKERIKELDWMTSQTKKKALAKLEAITFQLGYPDKWESYKGLTISTESHVQNILHASIFHFDKEMEKLGKPTDRKEWYMSAPTVNAYYSPNLNQIVFPAGILQAPFFYYKGDDAVNYGAIGTVIGHELTHGFDDQGAEFDGKGNMKNWWNEKDKQQFQQKTKILERQFNKYTIVDDIKVNGKLTLGENIADLGGLVISYKAFQLAQKGEKRQKKYGFTPDQRFFISYAISEQTKMRGEFLKFIVLNDPHSPSEFRVNGPLSNMKEFYEAFNVKVGDILYRGEKQRANVW